MKTPTLDRCRYLSPFDILIVDQYRISQRALSGVFRCVGCEKLRQVTHAEEAICEVQRRPPDIILIDYSLPSSANGIDFTLWLRSQRDNVRLCGVSAYETELGW